jgi:hypothetical protein
MPHMIKVSTTTTVTICHMSTHPTVVESLEIFPTRYIRFTLPRQRF